jgi:TolB protein
MRCSFHLAVLFILICVLAGKGFGKSPVNPDGPMPDDKTSQETIVGGWRADSVTITSDDGKRKTISGADSSLSLIVTEKTFTLRMGDKVLVDMSYISNTAPSAQRTFTIDLKSEDGAILGMYRLDGDRARIGLNDASKGRPKDLSYTSCGLVLALKRAVSQPLWMMNVDGTNRHEFFSSPEYGDTGSPSWSPDGSKVAFDSVRTIFGESWNQSRIVVVDVTGGALKDVGNGVQPSWSPDGKRLAFTGTSGGRQSMCIMNVDGSDVQQLVPNSRWAKWSPTADELVYTQGADLWIYDRKTEKSRALIEGGYQRIANGFNWSPDGEWICYKGDSATDGWHTAVIHREGREKGFRVILPTSLMPEIIDSGCFLAWEKPDGRHIMTQLCTKDCPNAQMYLLDAEGKVAPQLIPGLDPKRSFSNGTWSPDGKRIIFCVRPTERMMPMYYGPNS